MSASQPAPLAGIRVLEVANMIAAPSAGAMMADLGAEVTKVEPLGGDILRSRRRAGFSGGYDPWFELDNRGKRGLALDLARSEAVQIVHRLAGAADVFLTNLTAERQERYDLTPDAVHVVAPTAVHASLTGYGTSGPDADRLAYDMTAFFARGGIQSLIREPGAPPAAFRPGQGDHTSSLALLSAILAALRLRDATGEGQTVEVALLQVAAWTISTDLAGTLATGEDPVLSRRSEWANPLTCRYRCADDRWIALCMPGPKDFFEPFAQCMGCPDWLEDERFADPADRQSNAGDLVAVCDELFATATRAQWADRLDAHGLTWAPIQSPSELATDPQAEAIGVYTTVAGTEGRRTVAAPFRIVDADVAARGPAPGIGEHARTVLGDAGYEPEDIEALIADGVVGTDR